MRSLVEIRSPIVLSKVFVIDEEMSWIGCSLALYLFLEMSREWMECTSNHTHLGDPYYGLQTCQTAQIVWIGFFWHFAATYS